MRVSGSKKSAIFVRSSRTTRRTRTWPYHGDGNIRNSDVYPQILTLERVSATTCGRSDVHTVGQQTRSLSRINCVHVTDQLRI